MNCPGGAPAGDRTPRDGRRVCSSRMQVVTRGLLAVVAWLLLAGAPAQAEPPSVQLKSGRVLQGRVAEQVLIQGARFLRVETDFGQLLVPQREVEASPAVSPAPSRDATYVARTLRVVRIQGRVERRPKDSPTWKPVSFEDEYGKRRTIEEVVFAGDTVRTGPDGGLDVMLHRDAWVRLSAETEVEFPAPGPPARGSLLLARGATAQQVNGRPRGEVFRVATPTTVLGVKGTIFSVASEAEGWSCSTLEGEVSVGDLGVVRAGETGRWAPGRALGMEALSIPRRRSLERPFLRYPSLDMVYVPKGRYTVGGYNPSGAGSSRPKSGVELDAFWISRCEVSLDDVEQYRLATGAKFANAVASQPRAGAARDRPAVYLDIGEAAGFASWIHQDIATEDQWEAAARGPTGQEHPWGSSPLPASARVVWGDYGRRGDWALRGIDALGPVTGPTDDVSPFGCLQLASNAPELCWISGPGREPSPGPGAMAGPARAVLRGLGNHVAGRAEIPPNGVPPNAAFRCAVLAK